MKISAIAVISKNRALGKDNALLFHVPGDLPRFKKITSGHPVIMGRKTFESKEINRRPLPNRLNIVVTRDKGYVIEGVVVRLSIEGALEVAKKDELFSHMGTILSDGSRWNEDNGEVFIIGGGQIYQAAWSLIDKLYLTVVDTEIVGDTFFPDYTEFSKIVFKEEHDSGGLSYTFLDLEKVQKR